MLRPTHVFLLVIFGFLISLIPPGTVLAKPQIVLFPETGFAVSDTAQAPFLKEFTRFGGVDCLGYPISQPFVLQGFVYQVFQRAVLQWQPATKEANLANVLDWLSENGNNDYLLSHGMPTPESGVPGLDFAKSKTEREAWLTDDAIAQAYRLGGGMDRFGLPSSRPQRSGPFIVQTFQRYVFQFWLEDVPGMPPKGTVVGVLVGDFLVRTGIVPSSAIATLEAGSSVGPEPVNLPGGSSANRVTAIGDSVMLAASNELEKALGDVDIDASVGRQVSAAIDVIRVRAGSGQLGQIVIIHIGNNGSFTSAHFNEIMQLLGPKRRVVFVNLKVPRPWEISNNNVLTDGGKRHSNTRIVDWHSLASVQPGLLWEDGVHLRPDGARSYARSIVETLNNP